MKQSIYRDAGTVRWSNTIGEAAELINSAKADDSPAIVITGACPGVGKSTMFEYVANRFKDRLAVEGDILATIGMARYAGITDEKARLDTLARGEFKVDGKPINLWALRNAKGPEADGMVTKALLEAFPNIGSTLKLATSSFADPLIKKKVYAFVIADLRYYTKNVIARTKRIIQDSPAIAAHVKVSHAPRTWDEYRAAILKSFASIDLPVFQVVNFGDADFDVSIDSFLRTFYQMNSSQL